MTQEQRMSNTCIYARHRMNDEEFLRLPDEYLSPPAEVNPEVGGIEIVRERGDSRFGAQHIWDKHGITEREVEEVIFEVPPYVEARRHRDTPIGPFFGARHAMITGS